ncbi:HEAT repeat domain-containing protein [Dactylosporangium sp. NPDC049742]|uniref:HEAT repeat domain-containing protein n=1 Tax=Dactylosporangium sp. NPDC049742 TaxID=3154737 RepID=UPI00342FA50D
MPDADRARLARIAAKLTAARALPALPAAFGVESHGCVLEPPVPEAAVTAFEERHEVTLPPAYRLFITELGAAGAGPGHEMPGLPQKCWDGGCRPGHLAEPSPYLPGPRYFGDWQQRYEDPPGPVRNFLRGTVSVAAHGCSLLTQLVVTGPARGRLFNVDFESEVGPYVVEDADFLAWYERWLDEAVAGHYVGWFGERSEPDDEVTIAEDAARYTTSRTAPDLVVLAVLGRLTLADVLPELAQEEVERRRRAAYALAWTPWGAKTEAIGSQVSEDVTRELLHDPDPLVRYHAVAAVRWYSQGKLNAVLRERQKTETDGWVRHVLDWSLDGPYSDPWIQRAFTGADDPPF